MKLGLTITAEAIRRKPSNSILLNMTKYVYAVYIHPKVSSRPDFLAMKTYKGGIWTKHYTQIKGN